MIRTKEEILTEAKLRMEKMEIFEGTIEQFIENGRISYSLEGGNYWLVQEISDADLPINEEVQKLEEQEKIPYFIIFTETPYGNLWAVLFVTTDDSTWEAEHTNIESNKHTAYVFNEHQPECSEEGIVEFKKIYGGLIRTA